MSGKSHFETLLDAELLRCAQDALAVPLGDSHRHALVKGEAMGLETARRLYRKAIRIDIDPDDIKTAA